MAEGIFKNIIDNSTGLDKINAGSAGTRAMSHYSIFGDLAKVMEENDLDYSDHTPTRINKKIMKKSDLILVMTESHKKILTSKFPDYKDKIFLLSEFAGQEKKDISDPIGQGLKAYRKAFKEINGYIRKIKERLINDFK